MRLWGRCEFCKRTFVWPNVREKIQQHENDEHFEERLLQHFGTALSLTAPMAHVMKELKRNDG